MCKIYRKTDIFIQTKALFKIKVLKNYIKRDSQNAFNFQQKKKKTII